MRRSLILLAVVLVSCHGDSPTSGFSYNYDAPIWAIDERLDGIPQDKAPTVEQLTNEANRVTACWLDYAEASGLPRPIGMPGPGEVVYARVTIQKNCSNSADMPGDGAYGAILKGWSCTHDDYKSVDFMVSAWGHFLCHRISGCPGNECHDLYARTCGC